MAKRRAEDSLLFETSSKKPCRLHHAADTVLENVSAGVGVCLSPVSLPDGCCRKRRYHSTEPERKHETAGFRVADKRKNDAVEEEEVLTVSGKYENSSLTSSARKRPHEEPLDLNTLIPEATKVSFFLSITNQRVYYALRRVDVIAANDQQASPWSCC